jgi:hypothetical protein
MVQQAPKHAGEKVIIYVFYYMCILLVFKDIICGEKKGMQWEASR